MTGFLFLGPYLKLDIKKKQRNNNCCQIIFYMVIKIDIKALRYSINIIYYIPLQYFKIQNYNKFQHGDCIVVLTISSVEIIPTLFKMTFRKVHNECFFHVATYN